MEKKLKVLIAENTAEFGVPCSNLLKTYGMDVVLTPDLDIICCINP